MDDETLLHAVLSISIAAFVAFVVHLLINDDGNNNAHKKRKK